MNDLDPEIIAIVGLVLPPIVSVIIKQTWSSERKAVAALLLAIVAGIGAAYWQDAMSRDGVISSIVAVYTWMQITYTGLFKPSGITTAIETSIRP